jgi:outer membrane protein assembly factor BamB
VRGRRLGLVLVLSLVAGCLGADPDGHVAPDPIEALGEADCANRSDADRLSAWRAGPNRQGTRPCVDVPRSVELDHRLTGVNVGDHGAAKASPVALANGDWLVPGDTGNVHRVGDHAATVWSAPTRPSDAGIHGTPAVDDERVYVGAYDGFLYAFDLDTGQEDWSTRLGTWIGSSPVLHEGQVFVAVETPEPSGRVAVVNASSGEEVFRDDRPTNHPHSSIGISVEHDVFVVGDNDGRLYAWNLSTFERAWTYETGDAIKGPVAIHDGAAFVGSWDDHVYRVDLATGELDWRYETGANVMAGPAIDPGSGTVFVASYDENVYALDAGDGHLRWRAPMDGPGLSSPVLTDGLVLVGSHDGHLYAFDARDGEEVWRYEAGQRVTSTPAVQDGRVAFTTHADEDGGKLFVLEASDDG